MLKFVVIAVAAFVMWKLFTGEKQHKQNQDNKQTEKKIKAGEMVKDPICGTYVKKNSEIRVKNGERIECFCSYECRDKYIKRIESGNDD